MDWSVVMTTTAVAMSAMIGLQICRGAIWAAVKGFSCLAKEFREWRKRRAQFRSDFLTR